MINTILIFIIMLFVFKAKNNLCHNCYMCKNKNCKKSKKE